jgi:CRISPR-associated endonuclease/helicase Cas3
MTGVDERVAREVAKCTVSLPSWLTRGSGLDRTLDDLENCGFEGWQRSYWLKGVLPLVLDEELRAVIGGQRLRYDEEVGLVVEGKELA